MDRPLSGLRIVDCVRGPLAAASRYLAELGACVDRIVPPDHDDALRDAADNLGKWRHEIALDSPQAGALLAKADLVIEDVGLDAKALIRARPSLVVLSVTAFGRGNSLSNWRASDAVLHALSGELSRSGIRGHAPLQPPGRLSWQCAAAQAAFVALQSCYLAVRTGRGDHIDFSALDGAVQALDPGFGIGGSATLGRPAHLLSRDRPAKGFQYPIFSCADGHVRICLLAARQWRGMFVWLGRPVEFADPSFEKTVVRFKSAALTAALAAFFAPRSRADLETEAAVHGVPLSGLATLSEPPDMKHFNARGAFRRETVAGYERTLPNGCVVVDGKRMTPEPSVAEGALMYGDEKIDRPFAGLRVLDLGVIVVGAETGRLLADQGADVVKVESRNFPDGNRQSYLPYGLSVSFAAGHRNKRGLGLNLRDPAGRALFLNLVAKADILLSNFKPGTLASLGLGAGVLHTVNPRLICVESSAFGDSGPWCDRMGYGPLVRAATGLTAQWRYGDDPESFSDSITIYPDHVAARIGAIAAIALLIRRARTGSGGAASIAQAEVMLAQFGHEIALAHCGERPASEESCVYRCRGDDEWCVVTVSDTEDRRALLELSGGDVLTWMKGVDARTAALVLQGRGIAAAQMLRVADLAEEPYYKERGVFRVESHPHLVEAVVGEGLQGRGSRIPAPACRPAPLMGEDSRAVLSEWLGFDLGRVDKLIADNVVEPADAAELAAIEGLVQGALNGCTN